MERDCARAIRVVTPHTTTTTTGLNSALRCFTSKKIPNHPTKDSLDRPLAPEPGALDNSTRRGSETEEEEQDGDEEKDEAIECRYSESF